jgi:hypothetical protein
MQNIKSINFLPLFSKIIGIYFFLFPSLLLGKVDPKNYNFSLDQLNDFNVNKTIQEIKTKYGDGEEVFKDNKTITYKYYISHIRYRFPIFVTFYQEKSLGYFAKLPSYFLHDVFHQSLINRFEKQDHYSKQGNAAIYIWNNEKGMRYTYHGQCTITCFPVYLQTETINLPAELTEDPSLLKRMKGSVF